MNRGGENKDGEKSQGQGREKVLNRILLQVGRRLYRLSFFHIFIQLNLLCCFCIKAQNIGLRLQRLHGKPSLDFDIDPKEFVKISS